MQHLSGTGRGACPRLRASTFWVFRGAGSESCERTSDAKTMEPQKRSCVFRSRDAVYEPRVTGAAGAVSFAATFAAASAAAASFKAASFTAFAAAEREPRPESRLNWRIL